MLSGCGCGDDLRGRVRERGGGAARVEVWNDRAGGVECVESGMVSREVFWACGV